MNDFKTVYQSAVQDMDMLGMKEIQIDASLCMDEMRHKRRVIKQVRRATATAFSAMCIVFLCGFGTVTAAEYLSNVIRVSESGFESGDIVTMTRNETKEPYIVSEEIAQTPTPAQTFGDAAQQKAMPAAAEASMPVEEDTAFKEAAKEVQIEDVQADEAQIEEIPVKNYTSWEEFEKNEDIIFPQPSVSIGENIEAVDITVCGDWAMVRYEADERTLWIERTDYGNTSGHASSKVFPGGVCNERNYTTDAGYTYTLIDSVQEGKEEPKQIHAAITVGSYEVFADFMGYSEEEAESILDSIDVSQYEE